LVGCTVFYHALDLLHGVSHDDCDCDAVERCGAVVSKSEQVFAAMEDTLRGDEV
jgi:hypothetical protein